MSEDAAPAAPREPLETVTMEPAPSMDDAAGACPYLLASSGAWRASSPSRDHRCTAVVPPAALAVDKQRRLCLTPSHPTCATYGAARAARRERGAPSDGVPPVRWGLARTTPVVDVGFGVGAALSGLVAERRGWQAIPAVVLVLAVAAVGLSGLGRNQPAGAVTSPSPTIVATRTSSLAPSISPGASAAATPETSATQVPPTATPAPPTAAPTATAVPSARTTYTVKSGDTLYGIARAFGTSVTAIMTLNGLTSTRLHVGQALLIP